MFYIHTDHLNTPRRISRPGDNAIVWRWDSDPFGTTTANEDPDADSSPFVFNLRFPGQYLDAETGLHYNYMRDYDPAVGRYVQSDPIGLQGGPNTYVYGAANSISNIDPEGLCVEDLCIVEGIVLARAALYVAGALAGAAAADKAIEEYKKCDDCALMAKGGKQNIDNEYVRQVQAAKCPDPCQFLRGLYDKEKNSIERQKLSKR